jgi:KDO2-lipid IV(A) lauroyltransferase
MSEAPAPHASEPPQTDDTGAAPSRKGERTFAHDGIMWRRLARLGAAYGPRWLVEYSPPLIGVCAGILLPTIRRNVRDNLRRIRGPVGPLREARDVASTFTNYAGCLAEVLSNGSRNDVPPDFEMSGREHMERAIAAGTGVILVTAHTAGWEVAGPIFRKHEGLDVVLVMEPERDGAARALQDTARRSSGVEVAHVGADPFASLPLLHRLRDGAAVALQIDRVPAGMRGVPVRLFGEAGEIPEGPLRLAQISGAPIVPIFCARKGHRAYSAEIAEPSFLPRRPGEGELARVAQRLADVMTDFVRRHPTQWLNFGARRATPTSR